MKKLFFIIFSLIVSFSLFSPIAHAFDIGSAASAATDLLSVPVNDAQLRTDVRLFREKEIGTGDSTSKTLQKTANGIGNVIKDIGSKLPTIDLPNLPLPTIGGVDIGSWVSGFSSLFGGGSAPAWDSLTVTLTRLATDKIFDDMTDWVNRGFNGNPAFATNLNDWLKQSGDAVVGQALNEITNGFACQPFRLELRAAISRDFGVTNRGRYFQNTCSLSDISGNINNFLNGDFNQGGWQAWFRVTQVDENNPYGEYLVAVSGITANIAGARNVEVARLNWAQGFIGTRNCIAHPYKNGPVTTVNGVATLGPMVEDPDKCLVWQETTPGHLLADQVSKVTGTAVDQVDLANRFDEFLGAVVNQLTNRVFSQRGFITNTGTKTYIPEPITSGVDYGSGSGSGDTSGGTGTGSGTATSTTSTSNQCSVDQPTHVIGDTATWNVDLGSTDGSVSNLVFSWSGDEVSATTPDPSIKVSYTMEGTKQMSVSASYDEQDLANPVCTPPTATTTITCTYPTKHIDKNLICNQTITVVPVGSGKTEIIPAQ